MVVVVTRTGDIWRRAAEFVEAEVFENEGEEGEAATVRRVKGVAGRGNLLSACLNGKTIGFVGPNCSQIDG